MPIAIHFQILNLNETRFQAIVLLQYKWNILLIKAFLRFRSQSPLNFGHNQIMPCIHYIILNNFPVCWEYEITNLFHRTWAILYVTQYYFISPHVLGYHHSLASQALLFLCFIKKTHDYCSVQNVFMTTF